MAKVLDGKKLSNHLAKRLTKKVSYLKVKPKLVIIQVGDLERSNSYIRRKVNFAKLIGAKVLHKKYPNSISEHKLISDIQKFNKDKSVHGIIAQLPLPKRLDADHILGYIDTHKDVDTRPLPATTRGILTLLKHYKIGVKNKKIVVVGASKLVGQPIALAMSARGATVTICHSKTKKIKEETKKADILIVATGKPKLIKNSYVSKGQVIIDVGITVESGKVVGDVDYKNVSKIVRAITPVPGGVGPMTVVSLFQNLLDVYKS